MTREDEVFLCAEADESSIHLYRAHISAPLFELPGKLSYLGGSSERIIRGKV